MGQVAAGLLLLLACGYLLQVNDSARPPSDSPPATPAPALVARVADAGDPSSGRDYFVSRSQSEVIPLGRQNVDLPILMYHYIRQPPAPRGDWMGFKLSVSPADFHAQMDWLGANGYHPVDFNDLRAYFSGRQPLPSKPIVITFDDGYADLFTTAYPILLAHRFKAVAYIVSAFVGQSRYVSAAQVVQMDRAGIEIASHTVDHANLARSSPPSIMRELLDSKRWLEQELGHPVLDFAYPSGKFNAQVVADVRLAGYDTAVTTQSSTSHSLADRYTWARVRVGGGESLTEFIQNLGPVMKADRITVVDVRTPALGPPTLAAPFPLMLPQ
ncbi:polysaccharide deacetylase family protein [bacterium]|nr:MAG: polysaccharide deacetylase family protein [bacterium]